MRGALGGPRVLLRRLREVMAEPVSAQERLDKIVVLIAANMVAEVCSIYLRRASGELLTTGDIIPEAFICPSSDGEKGFNDGTDYQNSYNWQEIPKHMTYSYVVPFPSQTARDSGWKLNFTLNSDFPIALAVTLVGWIVMTVLAVAATSAGLFWVAALVAGLCMGSSQSAGRAMAGMFAPQRQLAEFYGLWTFAIRLASIVGPLMYGGITWATGGNQRLAIMATTALFVGGLVFLVPVNVKRGREAALQA